MQTVLRILQNSSRESNLIRDIFVESINDFYHAIRETLNQLGLESKIIVLKPLSHRGPPENYVERKLEEDYSQVSSDW